jgi:long-chain acyl-CoA synthetase
VQELIYNRLLLRVREQHADEVLIVDGSAAETAAEHIDVTLRLVTGLRELGLRPGHRIAVLAEPSGRLINVFHAAALGGFVVVPLNTRLIDAELAWALSDSAPTVVVADRTHRERAVAAIACAGIDPIRCSLDGGTDEWWIGIDEVVASGQAQAPPEPDESDALLMLYTGGTTGRSRGVVINHRQLVLALHRAQFQFDIAAEGSTLLSVNPLFHIAALNAVYSFPAYAGKVVIGSVLDVSQLMRDAVAHRVTHLAVVVAVLQRLLDHPTFEPSALSDLRYLAYGAAPMTAPLLERIRRSFPRVAIQQSYGLTEAVATVTLLSDADHRRGDALLSSVGRAMPGVRVTVRETDGTELPRGQVGEICVQSGSACTTYWNAAPDDADPQPDWLHTGDLGYLDDEGYLYLVDRLKDMVKTGGENVYSLEVEAVLAEHPEVADVAVIGVPDDRWQERVHAVVVLRPGATVIAAGIIEFARGRLAGFKAPKTVTVRQLPLPRSATGKVLKRVLREELVAGGSR